MRSPDAFDRERDRTGARAGSPRNDPCPSGPRDDHPVVVVAAWRRCERHDAFVEQPGQCAEYLRASGLHFITWRHASLNNQVLLFCKVLYLSKAATRRPLRTGSPGFGKSTRRARRRIVDLRAPVRQVAGGGPAAGGAGFRRTSKWRYEIGHAGRHVHPPPGPRLPFAADPGWNLGQAPVDPGSSGR